MVRTHRCGLTALAATTCIWPGSRSQTTAGRDSTGPSLVATFSYAGELVHDATGGARHGTDYAGAAGAQFTILLGRLVRWHGARLFGVALDTHGGAPSSLVATCRG